MLVIRGELLKRYPNAVIYAHRACWQREAVTAADEDARTLRRSGRDRQHRRAPARLVDAAEEELKPPTTKVLTPLYEAKVDPDIYFFGFDLTVEDAKGGDGSHPDDDPGLVLRHQGTARRATIRTRRRPAGPDPGVERPVLAEDRHRSRAVHRSRGGTGHAAVAARAPTTRSSRSSRTTGTSPGAGRHDLGRAGLHTVPGAGAGRPSTLPRCSPRGAVTDFDDLRGATAAGPAGARRRRRRHRRDPRAA